MITLTLGSLKGAQDVCKYTISKRIELESPGYSGFKDLSIPSKPEQPGLSSSIRLEVMYILTHCYNWTINNTGTEICIT